MKKPMTLGDFFDKIYERVYQNFKLLKDGELTIDFVHLNPAFEDMPLKHCQFDLITQPSFGNSEGVYLNVEYMDWNTRKTSPCVTIKTLQEGYQAFRNMGLLGIELVIEAKKYLQDNYDEFVFVGYKIMYYYGEKNVITRYCSKREPIETNYCKNFDRAVLVELATDKVLEEITRKVYVGDSDERV